MSVPFGAIERAVDRMYPPQLETLAGELAKHIKTEQDITALRRHLLKLTVESALEAELDAHLGYERHAPAGRSSGNSRNGYSSKTRKGDLGKVPIQTPRDRNYPEPTRRIHWLTRDHAERLLAELPPYLAGMARFSLATGCCTSCRSLAAGKPKQWQNATRIWHRNILPNTRSASQVLRQIYTNHGSGW